MERKETMPYLASLLLSIIIGFSYLFAKIGLEYAAPEDLLAHRFIITFICVLIFRITRRKKIEIRKENIKYIIIMGVMYPVLFFLFQSYAFLYISSSQGGIIYSTIPVFTLIIASFYLKEKASFMQFLGIILSVMGIVYLQYINNAVDGSFSLTGIILILISVLSITMQQILSRKYRDMFSVFDMSYGIIFVGFVVFVIIGAGKHVYNGTLNEFFLPLLNMKYLFSILYLSVLSTFTVSFLSIYALSRIAAVKVSIFNNLSALIGILAGIFVLNETFTLMHWIGTVAIIAGVVLVNGASPENKKEK